MGRFRVLSRLTLRMQLALLLALIAALLAVDRVRLYADDRANEIRKAERLVLELARRGADRQADILSEARVLFGMIAHMPESRADAGKGCRASLLAIMAEVPWLKSLVVTDPSGGVLCSTGGNIPGGLGDRAYFKRAVTGESFVVSDYLIGRATGRPGIVSGLPRTGPDGIETLIFGRIDLDWLSRIAGELSTGSSGRVFVIDGSGTVIAGAPRVDEYVGKQVPVATLSPELLAMREGVVTQGSGGAGSQIVGFATLRGTNAMLLVTIPRSVVLAPVNRAAIESFAKLGLTALFALLVVWLGGEHVVMGPLARLTAGVERLGSSGKGEHVRTDGMAPELKRLADAFNEMSDCLAAREKELRQANSKLVELAARDGLTGLANRRRFDESSREEWDRAARDAVPLGLVMVDVDHFKQFNDRYGHIAGDVCLRTIAEILQDYARRPGDLAARTGGEEFALLLPGATRDYAASVASRICTMVRARAIPHSESSFGIVTLSIGFASAEPKHAAGVLSLLEAADRALYRAKNSGRNRVVEGEKALRLAS